MDIQLRHRNEQVWSVEKLSQQEIYNHKHAYTSFRFDEIPEFLKDAIAKPKP
ncbi:hypothetical protein FRUB_00910 [Fimbriiglobus ruber]|uniref:Uncharacterized protein n=1 Tax=Fimbriiglobus ruber TaxID=1908690 RepID=A0A225E0U2_9BACT|nr:hypothetical protein FRUB_00910 [Fimbriiglobus ruber]